MALPKKLTIDWLMQQSYSDIAKLSTEESAQVLKFAAKQVNQKIKRAEEYEAKTGAYVPILTKLRENPEGMKISGKTTNLPGTAAEQRNLMQHEIGRARGILQAKTLSTVAAKKFNKEMTTRTEIGTLSKRSQKQFWNLYNDFVKQTSQEQVKALYGSEQMQKYVATIYRAKMSREEKMDKINAEAKRLNEERNKPDESSKGKAKGELLGGN